MKVLGIVAECNPYHEGHEYLIRRARLMSGADYCIVALSGDFTQRGIPAVYDKKVRTRALISSGADLVLEIPTLFAVSSAGSFAAGGIRTLLATGVLTHVACGTEEEALDYEALGRALAALEGTSRSGSMAYRGASYPAALAKGLTDQGLALPKHPNDLLAAYYHSALEQAGQSAIPVLTLARIPAPHASDLRSDLLLGSAPEKTLSKAMQDALAFAREAGISGAAPVGPDALSSLVAARLLPWADSPKEPPTELLKILDVTPGMAVRMLNAIRQTQNFSDLAARIKSKDLTYTRVCRALLHILLDVPETLMRSAEASHLPYLRVLGYRKNASALMKALRQNASAPLLVRAGDRRAFLKDRAPEDPGRAMLRLDERAELIYQYVSLHAAPLQNGAAKEEAGALRTDLSRDPIIL